MNPLEIYPKARTALYAIQWVINGVLAVTTAVVLALGYSPVWLLAVAAGVNVLGSYTGYVAKGNVEIGQSYEADDLLIDDDTHFDGE